MSDTMADAIRRREQAWTRMMQARCGTDEEFDAKNQHDAACAEIEAMLPMWRPRTEPKERSE